MAVRGIMAAFSRNARPDVVSNDELMAWYDNIHIPDVIGSSGINTALRFQNLDTSSKWPWLVVYPANDINFTQTDEFTKIPKGGHPEIKGYDFMELGEVDLRICQRVLVFETSYTKPGRSRYLITEAIKPGDDADFQQFYDTHYLEEISKLPGFRRATRYHAVIRLAELMHPPMSSYDIHPLMSFYEFDTADLPLKQINEIRESTAGHKRFDSVKMLDTRSYELVKEAGDLLETL